MVFHTFTAVVNAMCYGVNDLQFYMVTSYSPAQMVQVEFNPTVYATTTDAGYVNLLVQRSGIRENAISVNISTASLTSIGIEQVVGQ